MGPILGAVGVSLLYSWLTGAMPGAWLYVLGGLFIGVVLFLPQGITGLWSGLRGAWVRRVARGGSA
jgi:urea transport system permease protein